MFGFDFSTAVIAEICSMVVFEIDEVISIDSFLLHALIPNIKIKRKMKIIDFFNIFFMI